MVWELRAANMRRVMSVHSEAWLVVNPLFCAASKKNKRESFTETTIRIRSTMEWMSNVSIRLSGGNCCGSIYDQLTKHTTYLFTHVVVEAVRHTLKELAILLVGVRILLLSPVLLLLVLLLLVLLLLVLLLLVLLLLLVILLAFDWVNQSFVCFNDFNESVPRQYPL